ncbi:MAG TPA: hypothetical protein VGS19_22405 [Streptosporangiaceae bacterium]|nr:hypothetical protein [Streptosporangiaceae bacterium]
MTARLLDGSDASRIGSADRLRRVAIPEHGAGARLGGLQERQRDVPDLRGSGDRGERLGRPEVVRREDVRRQHRRSRARRAGGLVGGGMPGGGSAGSGADGQGHADGACETGEQSEGA